MRPMTLGDALRWAKTADHGDYLITWEESGLTDHEDGGSRAGFDDMELDEIGNVLARNNLTLLADDNGLYAWAVERDGR